MEKILELQNVKQRYGGKIILDGLSLELNRGEVGCVLGPSGSGKTTILKVVAGFEKIYGGEIKIRGSLMSEPNETVRPDLRRVGIVFQDYALFPHLTVRQNIEMGLRKLGSSEIKSKTDTWLGKVKLTSIQNQYPYQISGGEAQRVALARAMAPEPDLLLLDEPFSNLDVELRESLALEVREILKENGVSALLVTHDQYEAFAIADKVGVFHDGQVVQWGTPYEVYHEPIDEFVADFIGQGVFVTGEMNDQGMIKTELGEMKVDDPRKAKKQAVDVLLRPDDVVHDDDSPLQAKVIHKAFRGAYILYTLLMPSGQKLLSYVHSHHNHEMGSGIGIRLEADHVIWFPQN